MAEFAILVSRPAGVSNRWTGFSTGTWDWNVGLDYSTGMWDWNAGLEHLSRSVASSLRASYSLAVPVVWQFCGKCSCSLDPCCENIFC